MVEEFEIISLSILIDVAKKEGVLDKVSALLFSFKCKKNLDEEIFLHQKAILFEKQNKARTYLVFHKNSLIAFFSLSFKSIEFDNISKTQKKKLTAGELEANTYTGYLIGHIAKRDDIEYKLGSFIVDSAFARFLKAQNIIGGRLVYLDCKNDYRLKSFYENLGFKYFQTSSKTGLLQYYKKL